MKRLMMILLAMLAMAMVCFAQQNVKNLAVATFDITGNAVTKDEAESITELYITELVGTDKMNVVDRANFDKIVKEMKFQASDWSNKDKTAALGNAINAQIIARGKIMKVGSKMYLSATVIDTKTANVLSSSRRQFDSIDDIFNLLKPFAEDLVASLSRTDVDWANLKIGSLGPGGGLIFHIEGNKYYECSELLGVADLENAKAMCKAYKGGGYTDWYLPTKDELNYIYLNLRKTGKISSNDWYWSSSPGYDYPSAWVQQLSNGYQYEGDKYLARCVRAVRAFAE